MASNVDTAVQITPSRTTPGHTPTSTPTNAHGTCPVCLDHYSFANQMIILPCNHAVCSTCLQNMNEKTCPICHADIAKGMHTTTVHGAQICGNTCTEGGKCGLCSVCAHIPRCTIHHKKLHSWCVQHKHVVCAHCKESPEHKGCEIQPNTEIDREMERLVGHVGGIVASAERERADVAKMVEGHFGDAVGLVERVCEGAKDSLKKIKVSKVGCTKCGFIPIGDLWELTDWSGFEITIESHSHTIHYISPQNAIRFADLCGKSHNCVVMQRKKTGTSGVHVCFVDKSHVHTTPTTKEPSWEMLCNRPCDGRVGYTWEAVDENGPIGMEHALGRMFENVVHVVEGRKD